MQNRVYDKAYKFNIIILWLGKTNRAEFLFLPDTKRPVPDSSNICRVWQRPITTIDGWDIQNQFLQIGVKAGETVIVRDAFLQQESSDDKNTLSPTQSRVTVL
jgi:hypothetical protein